MKDSNYNDMDRTTLEDLLYAGLKSQSEYFVPKATFRQKFWNTLRRIFQWLANACERRTAPPKVKSAAQKRAEEVVAMLQENAREKGSLFAMIGSPPADPITEEILDAKYGPPITMGDDLPSDIPDEAMKGSVRRYKDPEEAIRKNIMDNVNKAKVKSLLRKDYLTPDEEKELSDLTKDNDIIVME